MVVVAAVAVPINTSIGIGWCWLVGCGDVCCDCVLVCGVGCVDRNTLTKSS